MSCYCLHYGSFGRLQKRQAPLHKNTAQKSCMLFVQQPQSHIPSVFFDRSGRFG